MCGIFGYIGKRNVVQTTLEGLKLLEYRGYDSAGIAGLKNGQLYYEKEVGKVAQVEKRIVDRNLTLDMAIAQTRWATHGKPSQVNAHPHLDSKESLAVVHNGIIENHIALKNELKGKGVLFLSDTDTEVVAHLVASFYEGDFLKAVQKAVPILKGSYALALIHKNHPGEIIAVASESPLCIGIGEEEMFVASDANAFNGKAKGVLYLEKGEIAVVKERSYQLFDVHHKAISRKEKPLSGKSQEVSRGDFEHFTLKEIFEQPHTIRAALLGRCVDEYGTAVFEGLDMSMLLSVQRIIILACGTSYYAGFVGEYMLEEVARIPTQVEISSEYRYKNPIVPNDTLVIAISQSGETADTLAALRELKAKGARVIAICNVEDSSIAREADACIYLKAGPEIGVCSTKAFTSQVSVIALFTLMMARMRHMSREEGQHFLNALKKIPDQVQQVLSRADHIKTLAKKYAHFENFFFLGRRYMYPAALEGALKLKEIAYINANAYPAGEMKHGPIALINPECPTVAYCGDLFTEEKLKSNLMEVKARSGPILAIIKEGITDVEEIADDLIWVPNTIDELSVIPLTIASQLFAYYVALERGAEIDKPRNLAKSVTVE